MRKSKSKFASELLSLVANENGMVIVVALMTLLFLTLIGTAIFISSSHEVESSGNYSANVKALYFAEAGLQRSLSELAPSVGDWDSILVGSDGKQGTDDDGILFENEPFKGGTFTVTLYDDVDDSLDDKYDDTNNILIARCMGEYSGQKRALEAQVEGGTSVDGFGYALFAGMDDGPKAKKKSIEFKKDGATINGDIHSNGRTKITKKSVIDGSAEAVYDIDNEGTITGTIAENDSSLFIPIPDIDFDGYRNEAIENGTFFPDKESFQDFVIANQDTVTGDFNIEGVFFVEGEVHLHPEKLKGMSKHPNINVKGLIVAYKSTDKKAGKIKIHGKSHYHHEKLDGYPTLMATNGIEIEGQVEKGEDPGFDDVYIEGLIYNAGEVRKKKGGGIEGGKGTKEATIKIKAKQSGAVHIKGVVMSPIIVADKDIFVEYEYPGIDIDKIAEADRPSFKGVRIKPGTWREISAYP